VRLPPLPFTADQASLALGLVAAVVVAAAQFVEPRRPGARRGFTALLGLLALLSALTYPNLGRFKAQGLVHTHEQAHFFLGSKYLPELRYDGLYLALAAAEEERSGALPRWELRDLRSFAQGPPDPAAVAAVRGRFTAARWSAFAADVQTFRRSLRLQPRSVVADHGNTGSPAWAMVAWPFTATLPLGLGTANLLGGLDLLLLLGLFAAVWRVFGARAAFLTAILALLPVRAWAYLGGSILRLDWLFALGMAACMVGARRWRTGGLFLGYAIASKVFCGLPALFLGLRFAGDAARERRVEPAHARLVGFAVVGLLLSVGLSSGLFGGPDIWVDYTRRILASLHEGYYRSQYSLRDVVLQVIARGPLALFDPLPGQVAAARMDVAAHGGATLAARLLLLLVLGLSTLRNDAVFAFWAGALGIYVALVTNMYYWQLFLLLGIAAGRPGAPRRHGLYLVAGLCLVAVAHLPAVLGWKSVRHGWFGSFWLFWTVVGMGLVEGVSAGWARRRAG
jgi:hypothetical protein